MQYSSAATPFTKISTKIWFFDIRRNHRKMLKNLQSNIIYVNQQIFGSKQSAGLRAGAGTNSKMIFSKQRY
jgi:hypothetical protein